MSIIDVEKLIKDYGSGRGVFDVSIHVDEGEVFGFLGPNGAGKSTTIRHLMGFSKPDSGATRLFGKESFGKYHEVLDRVGYIPGEIALPAGLTGWEFIHMMQDLQGHRNEHLLRTLVGTIFFKMAGLLLPIIYMIMTANALIAGQVDSGSMAYILASSTKRRTVTFTQAIYLIGSLFAMFVCTAITSIICMDIVEVDTELTWKTLTLINLGAFLVMFAMSGICFLSSCWFDRSKNSMALGGGLSMFFLVATMLGLFGSEVMPSILRMKALNYFIHNHLCRQPG